MKKSLSLNAAMSAFKTLMNIIFPLITFPYASNVLQVENLGKVNFASSVCGYFLLFAGLGISSYAVREGSRYVNDREKLSVFASEMFSINMISTALTYAALAVTMLFWTKFHAYTDLMLVLSLQIFFTTIGTEWVFTIFEEYTYITIRGLLFQVLSIFMLFAFVKTRDDYCIYAGITVFAGGRCQCAQFFPGPAVLHHPADKKDRLEKAPQAHPHHLCIHAGNDPLCQLGYHDSGHSGNRLQCGHLLGGG